MSVVFFFFLILTVNSGPMPGVDGEAKWINNYKNGREEIAIPSSKKKILLLEREGFMVGFDTNSKQALWVAYMLTPSKLVPVVKRANMFFSDEDVKDWVAVSVDYESSGYDRGHLAPAADMAYSEGAMHASFGYVNISPQKPAFNRGIWKKLEQQVRYWTDVNDTLWVVSGPLIDKKTDTIRLNNRIPIPGRFYKAVLRHHKEQWQAIAFLLPNCRSNAGLWEYTISVDKLETEVGVDFFPALPDSIEYNVESEFKLKEWFKQYN